MSEEQLSRITGNILFQKFLKDISSFCGALFWTCFGLPWGFKGRVDLLACVLHHLHALESSDSPLVQHLLISLPSMTVEPFFQVLANKHWWDLRPVPIDNR